MIIVVVGSLISAFMKVVMVKDHSLKIQIMGFSNSIIFTYLIYSNKKDRLGHSYFLYSLVTYIILIGLIKFLYLKYQKLKNKDLSKAKI